MITSPGTAMARRREIERQQRAPVMRVVHEVYGTIDVRAFSPFDAQIHAAKALGIDWMELRGCRVIWPEKETMEG